MVSTVRWSSSNSTRPGAATSSSSSRNRKLESPAAISSPCRNRCSFTTAPLTRVPLRLSRSRTWNSPFSPRNAQCFRETDGSMTATLFVASLPIVTSPSGRGIVESFKGPESTKSLGRKGSLPRALSYHSLSQNTVPNSTCSIIRTDSRAIQSDSRFRCKMD